MTQEEIDQQLKEAYDGLTEYYDNIERINNRVFKAIESFLGERFLSDLQGYLEDLDITEPFYFKDEPIGKFQLSDESGCISGVWIQKWSTGMDGDSYSGNISIKLKDYKWLIIPYSC